jgi:L-lactate dehydrogenase complex protein LldG
MSRAQILASIRQSLKAASHLPVPPHSALSNQQSPISNSLILQFEKELLAVSGQFFCTTHAETPALVLQLIQQRHADAALAWSRLPVMGVYDHLRENAVRVITDESIPATEPERSKHLAAWEKISIGITGVDAVIAETGTMGVLSGPGKPRLASLSVTTHIALFTPEQLYANLEAWWATAPDMRAHSNLVLITGPSRTADIEMTLTVGVHGPKEVLAVCVQG